MKINNVRLSFPNLFRRAVFNGEDTKFGATLLLDKKMHAEEIVAIQTAIEEKLAGDLKGAKLTPDRICLRDGDESEYDGYAGCMSLKASNNSRPLVIHKDKSPITEDDGVVYAGCYVNAVIDFWTQNNQFGKRINANILGLQFAGDGEPFGDGGRVAKQDDFDDISDENEQSF